MNNRTLITKLNKLKGIGPDQEWLKNNREILLQQISNSGASDISRFSAIVINIQSFLKTASQPAFALAVFVLVLVGGSLFSHQLFNQTKPNDSLYAARIFSEKAKLSTVFNQQDRNRLSAQFASQHAQAISAVLSNPKFNTVSNKKVVAKLNKDFQTEINTVKTKIVNLPINNSDDEIVSIASDIKKGKAIQISEPKLKATTSAIATTTEATTSSETSTSTATTTSAVKTNRGNVKVEKMLEEAEQSFNDKDYNSATSKLKEIGNIIK